MCKVIDNYLAADEHIILKPRMESNPFPWFYNAEKVIGDTTLFHYQFVHIFYANNNENSNFFNQLNALVNKLKPRSLIRIKANLNPVSHKLIEYNMHQDQTFDCKAAIYYLNDNDGYTIIGKEKVKSKKNRIVLFKANEDHYGTNSTNCKNRMVINFNYF